ncbi:hypothetical protein Srot_0908 [Segniliparus rotundus DSM 44985]|uniref:Lipoprotein n=1 Tax=Segniliparus rotundus (strain ATCC BAA-972 / CDC 1076 / CIP 108378 / DSM 44985 / JCM 13578) TaxID=640132 RepID=D6ZEA5_SEGRD|nr:hypothetical protein [Segniliparus rotundus]ADG97385.1 hypothetical protein Srot_0908 [Segniliparus rotundus DSM 44985]
MHNPTRNTIAISLALSALLAAGCQRGGATSPTAAGDGNSTPASVSSTAAPQNLVTPENAGKPVLQLKFGESVSFQKGGSTLVFTPKSLVKADGVPTDLSDSSKEGDCGVWWVLSFEVVIDAQPHATWTDWYADVGGLDVFQKGRYKGEYDHLPVANYGTANTWLEGSLQAVSDQSKQPDKPFHRVIDTKQYFGACTDTSHHQPSGLDPLGADLSIKEVRQGEYETVIARWLL